jgi:hypothetical protein
MSVQIATVTRPTHNTGYGIIPEYSATNVLTRFFIDTTCKIIRFEQNLDILLHAVASRGILQRALQSWVPDWTTVEEPNMQDMLQPFLEQGLKLFPASKT